MSRSPLPGPERRRHFLLPHNAMLGAYRNPLHVKITERSMSATNSTGREYHTSLMTSPSSPSRSRSVPAVRSRPIGNGSVPGPTIFVVPFHLVRADPDASCAEESSLRILRRTRRCRRRRTPIEACRVAMGKNDWQTLVTSPVVVRVRNGETGVGDRVCRPPPSDQVRVDLSNSPGHTRANHPPSQNRWPRPRRPKIRYKL